jgi:hypothetical protein
MPAWIIPLASLTVLMTAYFVGGAFWAGKHSADVNARLSKLEDEYEGSHSVRDRTIRLEEKLDAMKATFSETSERQTRTMDNMARQLANIATKGLGFQHSAE